MIVYELGVKCTHLFGQWGVGFKSIMLHAAYGGAAVVTRKTGRCNKTARGAHTHRDEGRRR